MAQLSQMRVAPRWRGYGLAFAISALMCASNFIRIFFIDILAVVRFLMMRYSRIDGSRLQELKVAAQVRNVDLSIHQIAKPESPLLRRLTCLHTRAPDSCKLWSPERRNGHSKARLFA